MKTFFRKCILLFIIYLFIIISFSPISLAYENLNSITMNESVTHQSSWEFEIVNFIFGMIQIVYTGYAVIRLSILGIRYFVNAANNAELKAEVKNEFRNTFILIVIGYIGLFVFAYYSGILAETSYNVHNPTGP